jgi:hypothetical protein
MFWPAGFARTTLTLLALALPVSATALADSSAPAAATASRCTWTSGTASPGFLQVAAGEDTSCSCGAFSCKGKEYPTCMVKCADPQTAVCDCGFCERTLGSPASTALGPVANACSCR